MTDSKQAPVDEKQTSRKFHTDSNEATTSCDCVACLLHRLSDPATLLKRQRILGAGNIHDMILSA